MRPPQALLAALAAACLAAAAAVAVGAHPAVALAAPTATAAGAVEAPGAPGLHDAGDRPGPAGGDGPDSATAGEGDNEAGDDAGDPAGEATPGTGVPTEDIIPEPNSGRAPSEAGDRGGILQIALLLGIVAAVGGIGAKVAHDSRRARQRRPEHAGR